jgi:hypothetical protein
MAVLLSAALHWGRGRAPLRSAPPELAARPAVALHRKPKGRRCAFGNVRDAAAEALRTSHFRDACQRGSHRVGLRLPRLRRRLSGRVPERFRNVFGNQESTPVAILNEYDDGTITDVTGKTASGAVR